MGSKKSKTVILITENLKNPLRTNISMKNGNKKKKNKTKK